MSLVVQVRGTSGSGKSTVVRAVMDLLGRSGFEEVLKPGRKKPLYYVCSKGITVLGHYETQCGGCDTIGSAAAIYDLIQELLVDGPKILCEGLLLSEDTKWTSVLVAQAVVKIAFLDTPLETCLRQIDDRRKEAGKTEPLNPLNTTRRVPVIERAYKKLSEQGIICEKVSPSEAPRLIYSWLTGG